MVKVAVLAFFAVLVALSTANEEEYNSADLVRTINNAQSLWKAASNNITKNGIEFMKGLLGAKIPKRKEKGLRLTKHVETNEVIPQSFDSREKWPLCPSIASIKDQGKCGSCWAVSVANTASDRICIKSGSSTTVSISAQNLMSCCSFCVKSGTGGCDGGDPGRAWLYFGHYGVVTGGEYQSNEGCQPYEYPPSRGSSDWSLQTIVRRIGGSYSPICRRACTNSLYSVPYSSDRYYGGNAYMFENERSIQIEILRNGPVVATMQVYRDFMYYKSGIYQRSTSQKLGGHAIRLIGWGVERGVKYWLVANTWGTSWGEDGTFRILRGQNECDFESYVTSGRIPDRY